jgi:hypothetical protein
LTNPARNRRKERESNPQGSSLVRVRAGCRRQSACPSVSSSSGGRNRTCVPPVNSRVPVPARAPPESSCQTVGMAGFEPAISCSQGRRIGQAFLHPESSLTDKCPAGVEPARPPWRGGRLPLHHGHLRRPRIVKDREHRVGLEPTSPPYECGVFAARRPVPASRWDRRGSNPHRTG